MKCSKCSVVTWHDLQKFSANLHAFTVGFAKQFAKSIIIEKGFVGTNRKKERLGHIITSLRIKRSK